MKLIPKLILGTVIVIASGVTIALMGRPATDEQPISTNRENSIRVQTAFLNTSIHQPEIRLLGTIEARQSRTMTAELNGDITAVNVSPGDVVTAGTLLLEIDNEEVAFGLLQTQADLADMEARVELQASQQQLDQQALTVEQSQLRLLEERLQQQRAVSASQQALADIEQQIQRQRLAVAQLEASVANAPIQTRQLQLQQQKAEIAVERAERQVAKTQLTAAFDGKVGAVHVRDRQNVTAGQSVASLFSHEDLLVKVNLPLSLANRYEQMTGRIESDGRTSDIVFSYANAILNSSDAGISAWLQLQSPERWLPGEVVDVVLTLPMSTPSLKVPVSALFQDRFIYTVDEEQRMQARAVQLIGRVREDNTDYLLVTTDAPSEETVRVITTRLNNPVTGSKIYEQGVDPDPTLADNEEESSDEDVE